MTERRQNTQLPMADDNFYQQLEQRLQVYEGCGNVLGIVPLTQAGYPTDVDFRYDPKLRAYLQQWGRQIQSDSVMVLTGDPKEVSRRGYHYSMYVFEPNGEEEEGLPGGVSTMCGNGVRAVAAYVRKQLPDAADARVMTLSGIRTIEFEGDQYLVNMGEFTSRAADLGRYIDVTKVLPNDQGEYYNSAIPDVLKSKLNRLVSADYWSIGLTGNRGEDGGMDGEPHIVLEAPKSTVYAMVDLHKLTIAAGPLVTKYRQAFAHEINLNMIVVQSINGDRAEIMNCTHERNLGDDPVHSVTQACGTGSTVAGGFIMRTHPKVQEVLVHCLGGDLTILRKQAIDELFMKGPAVEKPNF